MRIWGIADLHLSNARPERRERFAARWRDHARSIEQQWREVVSPGDLVLIPGDISMARNHRELQADLTWLERLPGIKVLAAGNHDVWWNRIEAIRPLLRRSQRAVGGDAVLVGEVVVCGTLGAAADDAAGAGRELDRLRAALDAAAGLRGAGRPLYVLWHYPPFDDYGGPGPCVALLEAAGVTACVYGHVHASRQWATAVQGLVGGVRYACVAADAIGFRPLRLDGDVVAAGPTR